MDARPRSEATGPTSRRGVRSPGEFRAGVAGRSRDSPQAAGMDAGEKTGEARCRAPLYEPPVDLGTAEERKEWAIAPTERRSPRGRSPRLRP